MQKESKVAEKASQNENFKIIIENNRKWAA